MNAMTGMATTAANVAAATASPGSMNAGSMMDGMNMTMMSMSNMMLFSTQNVPVSIFSTAFTTMTEGQYVGAWFFAFTLAVIWRAVVFSILKLDAMWAAQLAVYSGETSPNGWRISPSENIYAWRLSVNLPRAFLAVVSQGLAYLLMIIVMIMNVGLFFAVLVGYFIGELIFGRVGGHSTVQNC